MGVAVGFCNDEAKPDGPVHDQDVAPVEFAFSVSVPPAHMAPLFVIPDEVGTAFTVTMAV